MIACKNISDSHSLSITIFKVSKENHFPVPGLARAIWWVNTKGKTKAQRAYTQSVTSSNIKDNFALPFMARLIVR